MSTRGTYRVKEYGASNGNERDTLIQTYYIHYDNYPEGAADYFEQLLVNFKGLKESQLSYEGRGYWRPGKAIVAFGMLPYSEFTGDHETHGDTEFMYNLSFDHGSQSWHVEAWSINSGICEEWRSQRSRIYEGTIEEFIERYKRKQAVK